MMHRQNAAPIPRKPRHKINAKPTPGDEVTIKIVTMVWMQEDRKQRTRAERAGKGLICYFRLVGQKFAGEYMPSHAYV